MTVLQFILLVCGKMPVFDALNAAFATAGTGGFSIKSDGFAGYSSYLQIVTTVFMLLYSVNFASYYFLCRGKWKDALNAEVKTFFVIVVSAITLISLNLCLTGVNSSAGTPYGVGEAIKHAAFTVASIVSTTGFATEDFATLWPTFSCVILVALMFVGACAGSTGGGMKVSRHMVLYKGAAHEVKRIINPRLVKRITLDGRVVEKETVRAINAYLVSFVFLFALSFFIVSIESGDFSTGFTAVTATMNNIGPGLGKVGPSGSFGFYSWWSKLVFIFDMLAGRLEIFPMLVLFAPATWRR
jgi:trk system potassium uptake protein TrkH